MGSTLAAMSSPTTTVLAVTPYAREVLDAVDAIPVGKVMAYSDVAEFVGKGTGRTVGTVMGRYGGEVPWHRVVRADGSCAPEVRDRQVALLRAEGVPMDGERVDLRRARWNGK
jgi:alkylated DNA nucleotide flippase Atl1